MSTLERPAPPPDPTRRNWYGSTILAASLLVHTGAIATFVWSHRAEAARPPAETPIEVVQLPPEQKPEAKSSQAPKTPEARPPGGKQAEKPAAPEKPEPKKAEARRSEPKQAEAKRPAPQKAEQKKAEPKPTPRHAAKAPPPAAKPPEPQQAKQTPPQPSPESQKSVAERMAQLIGAPMDATALPAVAAGDGGALDDAMPYQQLVLSLVAKQKREGRHDGVLGYAVVSFEIGDHGEVLGCELLKKSDDPTQDAEAMAMVHRGAPYPPPPPGAMRKFTFGLRFQVM